MEAKLNLPVPLIHPSLLQPHSALKHVPASYFFKNKAFTAACFPSLLLGLEVRSVIVSVSTHIFVVSLVNWMSLKPLGDSRTAIFSSLECEPRLIGNKSGWIPRKCVHHRIPAFFLCCQ